MRRLTPITRRAFLRGSLGALAAAGAGACFDDLTAGVGESDPRLGARPGIPTLEPVTGSVEDLDLGGSRDGYLYVPASYTQDEAIPLFVAMHGAGGRGRDWQSYPARADAHGFAILAPDSRGRTWDIVRGAFGPDVLFLDGALRYTFDRVRVDPDRIVLGGFSDGASYALSLGVANGDLFTHLVAYSPGFITPGEPVTGKPRIFVSHGRQDPILSFDYTEQGLVPSLENAGYDVTFHPFDGEHGVPAAVSEAALDWFLGA